jgi:uncharacterized cupin superfamily protein
LIDDGGDNYGGAMAGKSFGEKFRHFWCIGAANACLAFAVAADSPVKPISIDSHSAIEGQKPIPKDALESKSPIPTAGDRIAYTSLDKSVQIGVWESSAGTLKLDTLSAEYIHVVEGKTVIRDASGNSWTYKAGDSFVLPPGFRGTAQIVGHFKKEFVEVKAAK